MKAKTYSEKPADVKRQWYLIDASKAPLGRVSTRAAALLIGKGKPTFTPHVDGGDYVVIINADKLVVSGSKMTDKIYYNHSGYPSGLRKRSLNVVMKSDPTEAITSSVRGMLPVNKLRDGRLARLKVYSGDQHKHLPQQPIEVNMTKETK